MTYKEKITWLSRYKDKDSEIDRLLDERAGWWAKATKITSTLSDMPKASNEENKIQIAIEKMIECEKKANSEIDEKVKIGKEIELAILSLTNFEFCDVLTRKYLRAMNFEAISKALHCSRHKVYNIHEKAINEINIV